MSSVDPAAAVSALAELQALEAAAVAAQKELGQIWELNSQIWKVTAATMVLLMQLGFSLIEAGTVRYKNTRNIMIKNALDTCFSAIAFWLFGYALAFGEGSPFIGWKYPNGQIAFAQVEEPVMFFFQFVFVATSATIFAGAVAERTQITAYLLFNFVLAAVIYPVVAHMIWSPFGVFAVESPYTILGTQGVLDNAGSMVVHVTGGVTSLVASWVVGPRLGRFDINGKPVQFRGHSLVFIAAGTLAIWAGFLAFNSGAVAYFPGEEPSAFLSRIHAAAMNTVVCAACAGATTFCTTFWWQEQIPEHTFNGVLGGLVSACATSSLVYPYAAAVIGICSGFIYLAGVWVVTTWAKIDDPVHATAVHLCCGSWGSIAAGLFAASPYIASTYDLSEVRGCGLFYGCGFSQLGVQILALLFVLGWVGLTSFIFFYTLDLFGFLRVNRQEEEVGLDIAFHGAGVVGEDVDIALAEEGGVDGRRLAALQTRLNTWRRLRLMRRAVRAEANPVPAAGVTLQGPLPPIQSENDSEAGSDSGSGSDSRSGPSLLSGSGAVGSSRRGFLPSLGMPLPWWGSLGLSGVSHAAQGAMQRLAGGVERNVWQRDLEASSLGQFSLAMYEANYVMEDAVEVHTAPDVVFLAVHDGHNGSEAAEFVRDSLWANIRDRCKAAGLPLSSANKESISAGFADTEAQFTAVVREAFDETAPHLATVGACTAAVIISKSGIWAANVGDCRAVLGQLRHEPSGEVEFRAVQLTQDHNLAVPEIREDFRLQHMDMPDAVQLRRGSYRVKGRVTITRCFGDLYLKSHEFNREPLVSRFRIPEPFNPPLLTADPTTLHRSLNVHDAFVIVASDGLFEFLTNEEAVKIVVETPRKGVARALIRAALDKASQQKEVALDALLRMPSGQRRAIHDDITVVVFFFDHDALGQTSRRPKLWQQNTSYRGGSSTLAGAESGSSLHGTGGIPPPSSRQNSVPRSISKTNGNSRRGSGSHDPKNK